MLNRIRELQAALGLNDSKFAEKIGVSRSVMSNLKKERRPLSNGMIGRIVARFGINENWLRTGEGGMFLHEKSEPTPLEFAKAQGCGELAAQIFDGYCKLRDDDKRFFETLVARIVVDRSRFLQIAAETLGEFKHDKQMPEASEDVDETAKRSDGAKVVQNNQIGNNLSVIQNYFERIAENE